MPDGGTVADLDAALRVPEAEDCVLRLPVEIDGERRDLGLSAGALARLAGALGASAPAPHIGLAQPATEAADGLRAPVAGTLTRWLVADGETVAGGQPVAVIEAMKMEMTLTAEKAGVLRQRIQPGEELAEGALLAEIAAG